MGVTLPVNDLLSARAWEAKLAREDLPQYLISLAHRDPENAIWYLAQVNEISDWRVARFFYGTSSIKIVFRKQNGVKP